MDKKLSRMRRVREVLLMCIDALHDQQRLSSDTVIGIEISADTLALSLKDARGHMVVAELTGIELLDGVSDEDLFLSALEMIPHLQDNLARIIVDDASSGSGKPN